MSPLAMLVAAARAVRDAVPPAVEEQRERGPGPLSVTLAEALAALGDALRQADEAPCAPLAPSSDDEAGLLVALRAAHTPQARAAVLRVEAALAERPGLDLARGVATDGAYKAAVRRAAADMASADAVDQLGQLAASVKGPQAPHTPEALA